MASISNTPTANAGTNLQAELLTKLVLGATTIDKGLMQVIQSSQDKIELSFFDAALDQLAAIETTPTTKNDSLSKTNQVFSVSPFQWYDTFFPRVDFEKDWKEFWHGGGMNDPQVSARVRSAILDTVVKSVQNNLEKLIWQGDTAGAAHLAFFDGFQKTMAADVSLPKFTDLGVDLTSANIIDVLQGLIGTVSDETLELDKPTFIMSHRDKWLYYEALQDATITKGVNIMDGGVPRYSGIPIISTGISKNKILLCNAGTGSQANLKGGTWMLNDTRNLQMGPVSNFSEEWGVLAKMKFGVDYIFPEQMAYYNGTTA